MWNMNAKWTISMCIWWYVWLSFEEIYSGNSYKTGELQFQHFTRPDYLFNGPCVCIPVSEWPDNAIDPPLWIKEWEKEEHQIPDVTLNGNDRLCSSLRLNLKICFVCTILGHSHRFHNNFGDVRISHTNKNALQWISNGWDEIWYTQCARCEMRDELNSLQWLPKQFFWNTVTTP